jgi:hypothetical protein
MNATSLRQIPREIPWDRTPVEKPATNRMSFGTATELTLR